MSTTTDSHNNYPLREKQLFDSFDDFKFALDNWAVQAKFSHRTEKSTPLVFSKVCRYLLLYLPISATACRSLRLIICTSKHQMKNDCPFFVRAIWSKRQQSVIIGTINSQHTCYRASRGEAKHFRIKKVAATADTNSDCYHPSNCTSSNH